MNQQKIVDYSFEFGLYQNQREMLDKDNVMYKLQALLNLMEMRPGTNQDNPEIGIDMSALQFSEGDELEDVKADIMSTIRMQASSYIDPTFIEDIIMDSDDVPGSKDGSKEVTLGIQLINGVSAALRGYANSSGFKINNVLIDTKPFRSVK